jgi:AraC-like DNA-binding protein
MLKYLNKGVRTTASWLPQWPPYSRGFWEFMAIVNGEACLQSSGDGVRRFVPSRLYISPPGSKHTWHVREGEKCEVFVLHFETLPLGMQRFFPEVKPFSVPLSREDAAVFQDIYSEVAPHYFKPRAESVLWYHRAILRICILILSKDAPIPRPDGFDHNAERAQLAIQYYQDHLANHLTVRDICRVLHISPPQLRRIFKQSLNESPKHVFMRMALKEACRLALEDTMSFKEIASRCGFAGFNQFYRAFRQRFGSAPDAWRRRQLAKMGRTLRSAP